MFLKMKNYVLIQLTTAAILSIMLMMNGYTLSWSASIILKLLDAEQTPLPDVVTDVEASLITNVLYVGFIGTFISSYISNCIGRRYSLIIGGVIYCASYVFLTFATSTKMVIAGRAVVGVSVGFIQLLAYMYIGEIASPNIRGILMTLLSAFQSFGCLLGYCLGPYISYVHFGIVPIVLTTVFIILSFFLYESPVYYVVRDDEENAKKAMEYFGRCKEINYELKAMFENVQQNAKLKRKWLELFNKNNRRTFIIIIPLYIVQQASGIIAVLLNTTAIFKFAGSSVEPEIATMIIGTTNLIGTLISPFVVDTYGRKVLLFFSTGGCFINMTILGTYFYFQQISPDSVSSLGWLPLTALVLALFTFSVGLTIIPHTLASEMFSPNVRGLGSSISLTIASLTGLATTSIYNYLVLNVGTHIAFWMFAAFNAFGFIFTALVVPETRKKSLTEINAMLRK